MVLLVINHSTEIIQKRTAEFVCSYDNLIHEIISMLFEGVSINSNNLQTAMEIYCSQRLIVILRIHYFILFSEFG